MRRVREKIEIVFRRLLTLNSYLTNQCLVNRGTSSIQEVWFATGHALENSDKRNTAPRELGRAQFSNRFLISQEREDLPRISIHI